MSNQPSWKGEALLAVVILALFGALVFLDSASTPLAPGPPPRVSCTDPGCPPANLPPYNYESHDE